MRYADSKSSFLIGKKFANPHHDELAKEHFTLITQRLYQQLPPRPQKHCHLTEPSCSG